MAWYVASTDAVVGKLVSRKWNLNEILTVPRVRSSQRSTEHTLCRSENTISHFVNEPAHRRPVASDVVSIVDHFNQETVCTAHIIWELMKSHFPLTAAGHVLGPADVLPASTTVVLVVSSNGCFQNTNFVRPLFQSETMDTSVIPIIEDGSFQFPSDPMFQQLRTLSVHLLRETGRDAEHLIAVVQKIFQSIGIHVRPQDSQGVLEVRAASIVRRLDSCLKTLSTMACATETRRGEPSLKDVNDTSCGFKN